MSTCKGVPPWAPLLAGPIPSSNRGAHGGTFLHVFNGLAEYLLSIA
jgi:hypothetical protein